MERLNTLIKNDYKAPDQEDYQMAIASFEQAVSLGKESYILIWADLGFTTSLRCWILAIVHFSTATWYTFHPPFAFSEINFYSYMVKAIHNNVSYDNNCFNIISTAKSGG